MPVQPEGDVVIDAYKFGHIVIDKLPYEKDVIVFPDRVQGDWWREEGHKLRLVDVEEALESVQPRHLVVGTGKFGILKVGREVKRYCEAHGIALHAEPTEKATKMYNRLLLTDDKVLGAFHLTC